MTKTEILTIRSGKIMTDRRVAAADNKEGVLGHIYSIFGRSEPVVEERRSYFDEIEKPKQDIEKISVFLNSNNLDSIPVNYALVWEYMFGTNNRLRQAVDETLENNGKLTTAMAETITEKHRAALSTAEVADMIEESKILVSKSEKTLVSSRKDNSQYGSALETSLNSMTSDADNINEQFSKLLELTNAIVTRTCDTEKKLKEASTQLNSMQSQLAKANDKAEKDQLTGLPNRWAFEKHFNEATVRATKDVTSLSVAFVDIDFFKLVNDTHGHQAGDRILVAVAKHLNTISGTRCHIARHGGEEFVILLEGKNSKEAKDIVDAVREEFASRSLINKDTKEPIGSVTFSAGVASLQSNMDSRQLLRNSDLALYYAKNNGRNQTAIFDEARMGQNP